MPAVIAIQPSGDPFIDGLFEDDADYEGVRWDVTSLTFSFPASGAFYGPDYGFGENVSGFAAMNAAQRAAVRSAFESYAALTNLTFSEITETATRHADLRFGLSSEPGAAYAYLPDIEDYGGDVWFNRTYDPVQAPEIGNYGFLTTLHEIGHALGLEHPHESGMPRGGDALEFSVMSYRAYIGGSLRGGYPNEDWSFPQSLMMHDIAALQYLYGADYQTARGATSYSFDPDTGEFLIDGTSQGLPGGNRVFRTIWDGGGVDVFDLSNYATDLSVDLRAGQSSVFSTEQLADLGDGRVAAGNVYNARLHEGDLRSLIENVIGGAGDNSLTGNQVANRLTGGDGEDRLIGHAGADRLIGGSDDDLLIGGDGSDVLVGGAGEDSFLFNSALGVGNVDLVRSFSVADDTIRLDDAVFRFLRVGILDVDAFRIGSGAADRSDRVVYDPSNGSVMYDADGLGGVAAVAFAQLSTGLAVTHADFLIA